MDLKKIDLNKLQDFAFTPNELALEPMVSRKKFINIGCLDNESIVPTVQAIPLDIIKQAREEIENIDIVSYLEVTNEIECSIKDVRMAKKFATTILDKLIAEN